MTEALGKGVNQNLGIHGLHSVHFAVRDLDKARHFYEKQLGAVAKWRSSDELVRASGQRSLVYGIGDGRVVVSQPVNESCKAARYLGLHPDGIMSVAFAVDDIQHAFTTIESRGGTPINDIASPSNDYRDFEIATPLGDVQFRFIEAKGHGFAPGFEAIEGGHGGPIPWIGMDHLTANTRTMKPLIDWYRSVLGFEHFWDIQFHTQEVDVGHNKEGGSGLRSIVMWDPPSGVKLASNEPLRPHFRDSQIEVFVRDNRGPGFQHIALAVPQIISAVDDLTHAGFRFLPAPASYYQRVAARLESAGCNPQLVKEPMAELQKRGILVDGSKEGYMLQIFTDEIRAIADAGSTAPAFYEVIQRAGDRGFGYGNFRALFEAIESQQAERRP